MKNLNVFIAILALGLISPAHAVTNFWANPGQGLWTEPTNWVGNVLPTSADEVRISNGGTAIIDSSMDLTNLITCIADTPPASGTLRITGGKLTTTSDIRAGGNSLTVPGGPGILEQLGGAIIMNGGNVNIGIGPTATGIYNMGGGSLQMNVATPIFAVGNRTVGTVNQTNGTIYLRNNGVTQLGRNVAAGTAFGTYNFSGGTLATARFLFGAATGAGPVSTNTFNLSGSGKLITGTFSNANSTAVNTFNFTGGTLTVVTNSISLNNQGGTLSPATPDFANAAGTNIENLVFNPVGTTTFTGTNTYLQGAGGILAIDVAGVSSNDFVDIGASVPNVASATLAGTIAVNLLNNFNPALGSTFDILAADSITDTTAVIGNNGSAFSSAIVTGGDGRQVLRLTVTAQPTLPPQLTDAQILGNGAFQFIFTNTSGRTFKVWSTTNLSIAFTLLGDANEFAEGQYRFTDLQATNSAQRFYQVRWP